MMPKGNKHKKQERAAKWGEVRLGSFEMSFPKPRLPRIIGAAERLSARNSVYPNVRLDVPINPQLATISAGVLSGNTPLDTTIIDGFSTRFATLFNEYAIVGARLEIRPNGIVNGGGLCLGYIDEESAAAPTASAALNRPHLDMQVATLTDVHVYRVDWKPRDYLDLDFTSTGVNFTPAWFKMICTIANTYTSSSTTGQFLVTGSLAFEFRGYA
jgi:hypothetical protein